jgi:FHA domain
MIVCPNCRSAQLPGTLYCDVCGAGIGALATEPPTLPLPAASAPGAGNTAPALVMQASGRRIPLVIDDELLLGRPDDDRGIFPDIDLSDHGGYEAGVSRRHAILLLRDGRLHIEDLNIGNGTFINGQRVAAHTPTPLKHGDELKLALLIIRVEGA